MSTRITFIRHGTTHMMEDGLIHGKTDSPLSPTGIDEVNRQALHLTGKHFDVFYCSPTGRAVQTAGLISQVIGINPIPYPGLEELNFGRLEGKKRKAIEQNYLAVIGHMLHWVLPIGRNGESLYQLSRRAEKVSYEIIQKHRSQSILIVSHSAWINMAIRTLTRSNLYVYAIPAGIFSLDIDDQNHGKLVFVANE